MSGGTSERILLGKLGTNSIIVIQEAMAKLIVDELDEEGSGMWSDSTTATMDYD